MATLLSSQPPPPIGWMTVLEKDCKFVARPAGEANVDLHLASAGIQTWFPDLNVCSTEGHVTDSHAHSSAFLPVQEDQLKKALNTWRVQGLTKALEELVDESDSDVVPSKMASCALSCIRWIRSVRDVFSPHPEMSSNELCQRFAVLRDWETSPMRALALHPRLPYIALGRKDDVIEIKNLSQHERMVTLKDKNQVSIMCLQWAPHYNTLLAVGCATGVLLWNIDPATTTTRILTSWVRVETSPQHAPVSSLSWSPQGNFLVSASPSDTSLITWDIPMGVGTRMKRTKGGGLTFVSWSPDGLRVFAASVSSVFRVWETQNWTCEMWTHLSGRCKAACWSPLGDTLVFALEEDPSLYYLSFHGKELGAGSVTAIKCADLTPCVYSVGGEEIEVGGNVQSMSWDQSGERLAIVFTPESPSADVVAVLRTRLCPMLEILPGGFVRGREEEKPLLVTFREGHTEGGALLAVAWSSGRISFTPLHFQTSTSISTMSFPEQLASLANNQQGLSATPLYSTVPTL